MSSHPGTVTPAASQTVSVGTQPDQRLAAWRDIGDGLRMYELWLFLGWRDTKKHYSRTVLGPLWLTLSMGIMVGSLGVLYASIFKIDINTYLPSGAVVTQLGKSQTSAVFQTGAYSNAWVNQDGSANNATVLQYGTGTSAADANNA
jgi:hypothetical protein